MAIKTCMECGCQIIRNPTQRGATPKFCGQACRKAFHNRAAMRGAAMYHYVMSGRFERDIYAGSWRPMVSTLATHFRDQDKRDRAGRQSWISPDPLGDPTALHK